MCQSMLFQVIVFVGFVSSLAVRNITRSDSSGCRESQRLCPNGACIPLDKTCDVAADYQNTSSYALATRGRRQLTQIVAHNQGGCVLPPYPDKGTYVVSDVPYAAPGQSFHYFLLIVSCRRGFGFAGTTDDIDGAVAQQVYCVRGQWSEPMPKCTRFCKLDPHISVRYMCHGSVTGLRECRKFVPPSISITPVCNKPIYTYNGTLPYMTCKSGYWDQIVRCKADCGLVTPEGQVLVIGGEEAKHGELPWHVGIYSKNARTYRQICGGSLISNNVVISAAHCFWSDIKKKLPASEYAVAGGKLDREWDSLTDTDVQKSNIKEIVMPDLFAGGSANFQEDIAALILTTSFVLKPHIRPVCLDFNENFERSQLQENKYGKIAGWGLTAANGNFAPILRVVNMPYVSFQTCIDGVPPSFREYITGDKICAGYTNGTALCRGDSGGGLSFGAGAAPGVTRYYLRGIVSGAPAGDDACNAHTYNTFTRITKHPQLVTQTLARAEKACPATGFQCDNGDCVDHVGADCDRKQDCADGSDESAELCALEPATIPSVVSASIFSKPLCVLPPYPDHGTYEVYKLPNARPGQALLAYVLTVTCQDGYDMLNPNTAEAGTGVQRIYCANGKSLERMPKCVRCGRVTGQSDRLEGGDRTAEHGELPWLVGIYVKMNNRYGHFCGGTLVATDVVISAANCFSQGKQFSASDYAVAAGKLSSAWDDDNDFDAQKSEVKDIKLPNDFKGSGANYAGDIAVVSLLTPFKYSAAVSPVCLELEDSGKPFAKQGDMLRLGAWSSTDGFPRRKQTLLSLGVKYLELGTCHRTMAEYDAKLTTADKICVGYTNDQTEFESWPGIGLVVARGSSTERRFYLRAVTSYVAYCLHNCVANLDSYFMLTKLSDYKAFLQQYV